MAMLSMAGIIISLDAFGPIGGYNFLWAWATGRAAGIGAAAAQSVTFGALQSETSNQHFWQGRPNHWRDLLPELVATDVAARGIHVDDVACVLHFDPPTDAKTSVHRSGRTARKGASGVVVSFLAADQVRARIGRWATVDPAGGDRCRVRMSTDSLDWPLMALGTVGAEFSVVSPPELVDQVRDWGGRFSRAARAG